MIRLRPLRPLLPDHLDAAGWGWLHREAGAGYVAPEAVVVTEAEVDALAAAADELYALAVDAVEAVIAEGRLGDLGVPDRLHRLVETTWADDRHWHVVGRFDLAGGIGGAPVKLIEFNADTPTSLPETAVVQWALLAANGLGGAAQFNLLYERLVENLGRWRALNDDLAPTFVATHAPDAPEDAANAEVMAAAAREAGFDVALALPLDALTFSAGEGVFASAPDGWTRFDFVFKFLPWETLVWEEPDLVDLLDGLVTDRLVAVANPPYALALQSKALLAELWRRHPGHPLLLDTRPAAFDHPAGTVEKVVFGREGANVRVRAPGGAVRHATPGDYDGQPRVWQRYVDLPTDAHGRRYQSGVFFAHEACALGVRRGGLVLDDGADFVAHVVDG